MTSIGCCDVDTDHLGGVGGHGQGEAADPAPEVESDVWCELGATELLELAAIAATSATPVA